MRSAAQTYKSVARQTSSPRELEASLLLQAAARLQSVHDTWDSISCSQYRHVAMAALCRGGTTASAYIASAPQWPAATTAPRSVTRRVNQRGD